jgi:hypothetical protein
MRKGEIPQATCLFLVKAQVTAAVANKLQFPKVYSEVKGKLDRFLTLQNVVSKRSWEISVRIIIEDLDRGYRDSDFWPTESSYANPYADTSE